MNRGVAVVGILLLVAAPLIVVAGVIYTQMLPKIYAANVRIIVVEHQDSDPYGSGNKTYPAYDPYFMRTQFEIIQSKPVLDAVIQRLNLQEEWGMDGARLPREVALGILEDSITVIQDRDTTLIRIIAKRPDPDEAACIANELAATYRDSLLEVEARKLRVTLEKFDEALGEQQQRVDEAEKRLEDLRVEYGVSDDSSTRNNEMDGEAEKQLFMDRNSDEYKVIRKAKADLENERFIYNQLRIRIQQEILKTEAPSDPVEIIDIAQPIRRPVSPNLFQNILVSLSISSVVAVAGIVLMVIGRREKRA